MKFFKRHWIRLFVWTFLASLVALGWVQWRHAERDEMERLHPYLRVIRLREKAHEAFHAAEWARFTKLIREGKINGNLPANQIVGNKPASALSPKEKEILKQLFAERFKSAIDRWANAYKGHIPFDVSEINLNNFYAVSAGCYTFMIGSTTFVIYNSKDKAKVFYLMTKQGAHDFNSIPTDGKPRDLSVPITKEEVLPMAEADTGLHYELKDIVIRPTGAYCVIDGGADVEVGIKHENGMEIAAIDNLSFTLGKDGKFITYQH